MPKVRMRTTAAGPTGCYVAGSVYSVTDDVARLLLDARAAELVVEALPRPAPGSQMETAALEGGAENTAERTGRPRRSRE